MAKPMASVSVKLVYNGLPALSGQVRAIAVAEVAKAAYQVEAYAKARVPVLTGTLRRSIHTVLTNGGLTGIVGPSTNYSAFVEFGTRRMGARPYMRPAAEAVTPHFAAAMKRALGGLD